MSERLRYFTELQNEISALALSSGQYSLHAFAEVLGERLENAEEIFNLTVEPVSCLGKNRRHLELLGYAEDLGDDSLVVLVGRQFNDPEATLTKTDARQIFRAGQGFLEQSLDGYLSNNLEPSSSAADHAAYFASVLKRMEKVKFFLVTDASMSDRIKEIPDETVAGIDASFSIWDIDRFRNLTDTPSGKEDLTIDFTEWMPDGLPLLGGEYSGSNLTYVGVLPGAVLAEIYKRYGTRLLESNVRTFLSARGKVNKGIQRTLAQEPEMFLAFNNGLATTATAIYSNDEGPVAYVEQIENWQIVNGGQTTASMLHYLRQNRNSDLDKVYVQLKLVLVEEDEAATKVADISRNANSQNPINEADFFSNSEYHRAISRLGYRVEAPRSQGAQYSMKWFYERTRGEYETVRNGLTTAKQKSFDLVSPRSHKITKTEWAKYINSWDQIPHVVSKGAQTNFIDFANRVDDAWKKHPERFNEVYFKDSVAKAIMFNRIRSHVRVSEWYGQGYLANIVTYSMAKLSYEVSRQFPGFEYDFGRVWKLQDLPKSTMDILDELGESVQSVLTSPSRRQANVTQWAKQEACWSEVKREYLELPETFKASLTSTAQAQASRRSSRAQQKMDTGFELVARMLAVPQNVWSTVMESGLSLGLVTEKEAGLIRRYGLKGIPMEEWQAEQVHAALKRSVEHGLVSDEHLK